MSYPSATPSANLQPLPSASSRTLAPSVDSTFRASSGSGGAAKAAVKGARACDTCRSRKLRCIGASGGPIDDKTGGVAEVPCEPCRKARKPCVFSVRTVERRPPVSRAYVESLEKRLEAMEELLRGVNNGTAATTETPTAAPASAEAEAALLVSPGGSGLNEIAQLGDALDDLTIEKAKYIGRGSGVHLYEAAHRHLASDPETTVEAPSLVERLMQAEAGSHLSVLDPMPPPDLAAALLEGTWRYIYGWPLLSRRCFDEFVASGLVHTERSFRSLYFAMLALGARFVDDPRLPPSLPPHLTKSTTAADLASACGYAFYTASKAAATPPLISCTIFDLLASCFNLLWLFGSAGATTAWIENGSAIRRAIDAGVHREKRTRWTNSPLFDQLRRRAFYTLLSFDRVTSSMLLGRPCAIAEDDFDVELPADITDDDLHEWERQTRAAGRLVPRPPPSPAPVLLSPQGLPFNAWECLVTLHRILGQAHTSIYGLKRDKTRLKDEVAALDAQMSRWLASLPVEVRWDPHASDESLAGMGWMLCSYYECQILTHREFLHDGGEEKSGFNSRAICTNAARGMASVLGTLHERGVLELSFDWVPSIAVTAGLVLILGVFAQPAGPSGSPPPTLTPSAETDVKRCLQALHVLSSSTFAAQDYLAGFAKLANLVSPGIADPASLGADHSVSTPETAIERAAREVLSGNKRSAYETSGIDDSATTKTRKVDTLPFSTHDLASSTFNGRATFSTFDASLPTPPFFHQGVSSSASLPQDLSLQSASFTTHPAPQTALPPPDIDTLAPPPPNFDSSFPSTEFWSLPFSAPTPVEQSFSDLLAKFGMPDVVGGSFGGGDFGLGAGTGWGAGEDAEAGGTAGASEGAGVSHSDLYGFDLGGTDGTYDPNLFGGFSPFPAPGGQ